MDWGDRHKGNTMKVNIRNGLKISGKVRFILTDIRTGEVEIGKWHKNIIPTSGREAIGRRLGNIGAKSNEGMVTYGAVGTGTTTPQNSDTQLVTEICRKLVASVSYSTNIITIRIFFTTAEANGDLKEFGLFGEDASVTVNSGTLFQRVLISKTKTASKTLTIESVITIS